jgi:hypothetical protein
MDVQGGIVAWMAMVTVSAQMLGIIAIVEWVLK